MVIWNELEDLRRRENAKRGYAEVKTPLIYDTRCGSRVRPLGEVPREHVPRRRRGRGAACGAEADELPGAHAPLRLASCGATATCRSATRRARRCIANELAGALHGLLRVRHVTQDDAHIFCTEEQVAAEIDGCIEFAQDLYTIFERHPARGALDPTGEQARHRRGVGPRRGGRSRRRSSGTGSST